MIRWLDRDEAVGLVVGLSLWLIAAAVFGWLTPATVLGVAAGTVAYLTLCWWDHEPEADAGPEAATDGGRSTDKDVTIAGGDRNRRQNTSEGN